MHLLLILHTNNNKFGCSIIPAKSLKDILESLRLMLYRREEEEDQREQRTSRNPQMIKVAYQSLMIANVSNCLFSVTCYNTY